MIFEEMSFLVLRHAPKETFSQLCQKKYDTQLRCEGYHTHLQYGMAFFDKKGHIAKLLIRFIWKPMHVQPIYRTHPFVTVQGNGRGRTNAYIKGSGIDVGADIFRRGLCLPSDNKMTEEQQDRIIEIIHRCFL